MKYLVAILCLMCSSLAHAQECQNFKDSGDGVPAAYYQHKCEGKKALKARQYENAIREFEAALAVQFYEAPNYDLNVELAEALCRSGKKEEAINIIKDFRCMVAVDLGELKCYDTEVNPNPKLTAKCFNEMCPMVSGLTVKGKERLLKRRAKMNQIEKKCK